MGKDLTRNIPTLDAANSMAASMMAIGFFIKEFKVEVDKKFTFLARTTRFIRVIYSPIYYGAVVLLLFVRILLAIVYTLLLRPDMSRNILTHIFIWEKTKKQ